MKNKLILFVLFAAFVIYSGCRKEPVNQNTSSYSDTPILPEQPYNYPATGGGPGGFNGNANHIATLGRVLFYDQKMSLNNSVSCGSCHQQSKGFADGKQFSTGLQDQKTRRNSPGIVVHEGQLFWDGRANTFYELALMPLVNHVEMMNYDISKLERKVSSISYYPELFKKAFGSEDVNIDRIQQAIAGFLQNFRFNNNKFNQTGGWGSPTTSLTIEERLGADLFMGKAQCGSCHSGPSHDGWNGASECIGLDETYTDNGLGERSNETQNNGQFRVPTLLNIEFTAPYMHDGRFKTLEEVIEHYNSGIKNHPNLSWALRDFSSLTSLSGPQLMLQYDLNHDGDLTIDEIPPGPPIRMGLTNMEKKSLVTFLKTFSDHSSLTDVRFSDPFVVK
ncbi:MAG: hypothetical protein K0Q95_3214 [Bacteroidota bacterium]|jgi:cytochrome c peroxidase|nr:hypothetical protein [Bacteroidota bacterium]